MTTTAHNLLTEPLLTWRRSQSTTETTTLPGLLSRLASGDCADFPRVRAHQFHPWCMFLTQLAAIALRRAGETTPQLPEEAWRVRLLALTEGQQQPWCLWVDEPQTPAFFQAPVPEGEFSKWATRDCPDELDMLVTPKGHDVKNGLIGSDDLESWVYALVTLQTMQGYPGRGYRGIARMKGGYGNRARVGLATSIAPAPRFGRDVAVLLDMWPTLLRQGYRDDGIGLVWTEPWDGTTSLTFSELSPHFIEACCRLRCTSGPHGLACAYTTTKVQHCVSDRTNGDIGDPWLPIERDKGALTVGEKGFHYKLLARLLFDGDFVPAAAQKLRPDDADPMLLQLWALARGQGKTEGLHERALALSGPTRRLLGQPDGRATLGRRASLAVDRAATMRSKVLYPALKQVALGGEVGPDRFDVRVDEVFFDTLFASVQDDDKEARLRWDGTLHDMAWQELQVAIDRCSVPIARRYRAISDAEGMFRGCLRKQFPDFVRHVDSRHRGTDA